MPDIEKHIEQLKAIAETHEEAYVEGSWERFQTLQEKKKRRGLIIPLLYSGIAASVMLAFTFAFWPNPTIQNTATSEIGTFEHDTSSTKSQIAFEKIRDEKVIEQKDSENPNLKESNTIEKTVSHSQNETSKKPKTTTSLAQATNPEPPEGIPNNVEMESEEAEESLIAIEDIRLAPKPARTNLIRDLGFSLSPGLSNSNKNNSLSFTAGIQADLQIAKRLFINTGVTLAHQRAHISELNAGSKITSDTRLISLEIPINLKIELGKASNPSFLLAGISSVSQLSERNTLSVTQETVVLESEIVNGEEVITYNTETTHNETTNERNGLSGFFPASYFNLSYGKPIPISKNLKITVAPFVKLPLYGVSNQNIKLSSGGVHLIISKRR